MDQAVVKAQVQVQAQVRRREVLRVVVVVVVVVVVFVEPSAPVWLLAVRSGDYAECDNEDDMGAPMVFDDDEEAGGVDMQLHRWASIGVVTNASVSRRTGGSQVRGRSLACVGCVVVVCFGYENEKRRDPTITRRRFCLCSDDGVLHLSSLGSWRVCSGPLGVPCR